MFCHNCGKEIPTNIKFCPHCGTQVITSPPTEPKPESEPESGLTSPPQPQPPSKPSTPSKETKLTFKEVLEGLVGLIILIGIGYGVVTGIIKLFSHSSSGLGIKAEEITSKLTNLGFETKSSPLNDGTPRIMVFKKEIGAMMDLIGNPNDLQKITILQLIPSEKDKIIEITSYILFIVTLCAKDKSLSKEIMSWITNQMKNRPDSETSNVFKNLKVSFESYQSPYPSFMINIEPVSLQKE
jgi:hypothetical protein